MFGKFTTRFAMSNLVAVAALVTLTGADCANDSTGGLLDPTGQLTSSSGEPDFVFDGGSIYLDGVQLLGDPQLVGYSFEEVVTTDDDGAKRADVDAGTSKSIVTNTNMRVNVKNFPIKAGTSVTFTPSVSGGTGLYWFFYRYESDSNWTRAGNTYTRKVNHTPYETLYFAAIDTNNVQSDIRRWKVPVGEEVQAPQRLCTSIAGTSWSQSYSNSKLTISLPQGQSVGARVEGSWCEGDNTLLGQIVASPSNCPDCVVVEGTWRQKEIVADPVTGRYPIPNCDISSNFPSTGEFRMTFEPDLASFSAKWSAIGESYWRPDYWTGSRSDCN